jgi:hypothetical protein
MPQKTSLLQKYGLSRNPFTDRTAEKTDLVRHSHLVAAARVGLVASGLKEALVRSRANLNVRLLAASPRLVTT